MQQEYRIAFIWQVALAVYMQLISWIPLGRWNYQPCCPTGFEQLRRGTLSVGEAPGLLAFLVPCALFWLGARSRRTWAMWLAVIATAVWLALQLWTWWPPYIFGASDRWLAVYERAFAHATPIFPRWGRHLPPDALHFILQLLLVGNVVAGVSALLRPRRGEHMSAGPERP